MTTPCPKCGGTEWSTASDGLGNVASVAAVCLGCGYLTTSVVDLGSSSTADDQRCTSISEDGRRCHGDKQHPGTHWAAASRVWSDTATLVRPTSAQVPCPRKQCRGRVPHSRLVHWLGR